MVKAISNGRQNVECCKTASFLLQGNHCIPSLFFHVFIKDKSGKAKAFRVASGNKKGQQSSQKSYLGNEPVSPPQVYIIHLMKSLSDIRFFSPVSDSWYRILANQQPQNKKVDPEILMFIKQSKYGKQNAVKATNLHCRCLLNHVRFYSTEFSFSFG